MGALGTAVPVDPGQHEVVVRAPGTAYLGAYAHDHAPGRHEVVVRAPGYETWRSTVEVAGDGASVTLDVPPLQGARRTEVVEAWRGEESVVILELGGPGACARCSKTR